MLQEVDQSVKNFLLAELRLSTDGLVKDESQIVIGLPPTEDEKAPASPTIYLFLHDLHENLALRDQSFEIRRNENEMEVGKSRRPTRLNVSYLLTASAKDVSTEHRLLGEALGVLMRNGFIPTKYLVGSLIPFGDAAVSISAAQRDHWAHEDAPKVWQAIGHPLKPYIGVVASAMFDPFETKMVRLVREALIALGQGAEVDRPDRQMTVRSVRVSAAGVITDTDGNPIPDAIVSVKDRPETAVTDEQGVFFIKNLPSGPHKLKVSKKGLAPVETEVIAPVRGLANELNPVAIQMKPATDAQRAADGRSEFIGQPQVITLVGTLRYDDGRPASFVPVSVGDRTAVTDEEGVYRFSHLPHNPKQLVAEIPGKGEITMPVKAGAVTSELPKK